MIYTIPKPINDSEVQLVPGSVKITEITFKKPVIVKDSEITQITIKVTEHDKKF
jgi:hypothetical protein